MFIGNYSKRREYIFVICNNIILTSNYTLVAMSCYSWNVLLVTSTEKPSFITDLSCLNQNPLKLKDWSSKLKNLVSINTKSENMTSWSVAKKLPSSK